MGPGITAGPDGAIWFTGFNANTVGRLAPDGAVTTYPVATEGANPYHIVTGPDGALWFTMIEGNKIGRIQLHSSPRVLGLPRTGRAGGRTGAVVATIAAGAGPHRYPAIGHGSLWVPASGDGTVVRIDPATNRVIAAIPTGGNPAAARNRWDPVAVAADTSGVWVTVVAARAIARIDPETNAVTETIPVAWSHSL